MQRLLIAALFLLAAISPALADSLVQNLATSATSPLPAGSCFYVSQDNSGTFGDVKLCSGYPAAIGANATITWPTSGDLMLSNGGNAPTAYGGTGSAPLNEWLTSISAAGVGTWSQPAFSNLSGSLAAGQLPSLASGDIWLGNGSNVATAVAMPALGDLVVSGVNAAPTGLAPSTNGDCVVVANNAFGLGSCGAGGSTSFTLAPGLTSTPGTDNTGSQTITNGSTLAPQQWATAYTANHTAALADGTLLYIANGTGAITFTLPQSAGTGDARNGNFSPCFLDQSGHGFTLATTTSVFYGPAGIAGSSAGFGPGTEVCASPDGTNWALTVIPNQTFTLATAAHAEFGGFEGALEGGLGQ